MNAQHVGVAAYKRVARETGTPLDRMVLVHERALACLRRSLVAAEGGDFPAHKTSLFEALRIVRQLPLLLDAERGGDLVVKLVRLYDYLGTRLAEANASRDLAPIREVIELLDTVVDGWRSAPRGA